MVDPTKGIGSLQSFISGTNVSDVRKSKETSNTNETGRPKDEVSLSSEALSLSEAKEAYTKVRSLLEQNQGLTLAPTGSGFDESL